MQAGASQAVEAGYRPRRSAARRRRAIMALSVLVLLAGGGGAILWWRQSYTARAMRLLVREFSQQRPVEGRFAGGFQGGRFTPLVAGDASIHSQRIVDASRLIDKAMAAKEPGAQLAYARLLLLTGEQGPATLKAFRQAVSAEPASAAARNDLGVCLLTRDQLEEGLVSFDEALQQQPEMPEALFNRAVCYQQLQLRDAASADFARLKVIDRDRSWRDEIDQRHQEVSAILAKEKTADEVGAAFEEAFAAQDFDKAGRIIDDDYNLIFTYASKNCSAEFFKAASLGNAEASQRELSKIRMIGGRLVTLTQDKGLLDLADYLQNLSREAAEQQWVLVREYQEIDALPSTKLGMQRQPDLERLRRRFKAADNRLFEFLLEDKSQVLYFKANQFSNALAKTREALKIADANQWLFHSRVALSQIGNIYTRVGYDSLGLEYCKRSMATSQATLYVESKANQFMANAYWHLGNASQGLRCLRQSSSIFLTRLPSLEDLANNTLQAADFYRSIGNHKLALLYAIQTLAYADAAGAVSRLAQTRSFMAVELARLGQAADSQTEIQRALASFDGINPYSKLLVLLRAADLASQQDNLQQAERYYAGAEAIAENSQEKPLPLIRVLKARAASYARARQPERARADLERAIAAIETYRKNITERGNRSDFFDASQDVFDQMIQLKAHAFRQPEEAFNTSEQARARTLLDDLSATAGKAGGGQPAQTTAAPRPSYTAFTLHKIRAALPANLRLISYSVTAGGTLIFVVTRKDFTVAESPATTEMLDRLVEDYQAGLREKAPVEELAEQSRRLYQLLIAPVESRLGAADRLCIAPDKALHRLPFTALMDGAGNYLVQSHVLTSVPSASTLVYCRQRELEKSAATGEKLLAVGNPKFSRDDFPDLQLLPEAEREVRTSARLYAQRLVLTGKDATKARALAELTNCDIAHFSTHCRVDEKTPWLAALIMAGATADKDDQLLRLNEFNQIGLLRARLVILSACQSGLGQYYRGEGIVSLVRPFLARSVPTVVASLWTVDSQATAALMIDFHKARKQPGVPAADALRAAQMHMMRDASFSHPYYWAPFVVMGSSN
jgi:CHAT domain-containing protein